MQRGVEHAMTVHGMKENDCTPEFKEKVRGLNSHFLKIFFLVCESVL
jgi:hypothetical protein